MSYPALNRLANRVLGGEHRLKAKACRTIMIAPATERLAPPALFNKEEIERITGVGIATTKEYELDLIRGRSGRHGPVIAYELQDATIAGSCVYSGALKHRVDTRHQPLLRHYDVVDMPEGVLACTLFGSKYFGHSIRDDLPLLLLAESLGTPVRTDAELFPHQRQTLELLGMGAHPCHAARFRSLLVIDDMHMSEHRIRRMRALRERVAAKFPGRPHAGVYIRRGKQGEARNPQREEELIELLRLRGFRIVDPDRMSTAEVLQQVAGARIVMATEGSHLAHGILAADDDCTFLVLQPPRRFNNIYKGFTDAMGMRYAFLVGRNLEGTQFGFSLAVVAGMLDRIESLAQLTGIT